MSKSPHIPYSAPVIKVIPLTIGGRALCAGSGEKGFRSQYWEVDDEYSYGELD